MGGVEHLVGIEYERIDDAGLWYRKDDKLQCLAVDQMVLCSGQESELALMHDLQAAGFDVKVIGGAEKAAELDAKRAIRQGVDAAMTL